MKKAIDKYNNKTVVKSHKELFRIVQKSIEQYNEIRLENLQIICKIDTSVFLHKKGIPIDSFSGNVIVDFPVFIDCVECEELVFDRLSFNKEVIFPITSKSSIRRLAFYDCIFKSSSTNSLQITDLTCKDFVMMHCSSVTSISFDCISCKGNFNIEEIDIKGGLEFRNFVLLPQKETEFYLEGRISQDVKFFNCFLSKTTNVNVETNNSIIFESINYDTKEIVDNDSKVLRMGKICMSGTSIDKQLVLLSCNIGTIDMVNVKVNSILEFDFKYNRLMNQAGTILRNGALQRNDDIAYNKYTADIYDDHLRSISTTKINRLAKKLKQSDPAAINEIKKVKEIEREYNKRNKKWKIMEPLWFFVTNVFSEEGLLLWLNKYSNNYNRSWFRGILFTTIIALVSYFVLNYCGMQQQYFFIDWHFKGFGDVFVGYLSLLDIFNLIGDKPEFALTPLGKFLMFLSKIMIAYGEWQTIYAFYKYRK